MCSLQARLSRNELPLAAEVNAVTLDLARRYGMHIIQADAWHLQGEICRQQSDTARVDVEITTFSGEPPIFGPSSHSQTVTFELARRDNRWRITSAPQIWQLS